MTSKRRSLVFNLALLFAISSALLLTSLAYSSYWLLKRQFEAEANRVLDDTVALLQSIFRQDQSLVETIQKEIPRDLEALQFHHYQLKIESENGQILAVTRRFPKIDPDFLARLPLYPEGTFGDGVFWDQADRSFLVIRAGASHLESNGQRKHLVLLVALDASDTQRTLRSYRQSLISMVSIGVVLSTLLAIILTRRGVRPLVLMTRLVQRLRVDRLHLRFQTRTWPLELAPLAQEFDRLLDEIVQGMARLSHFSSDLAHELRTPLASMMLEAEVILSQPRSSEEYQAVLASSVEELERLTTLVERLLLLARTEAARPHLEPSTFPLREKVERLVDYHLSGFSKEEIAIHIAPQATLRADPRLFELALGNLLSNAAKYAKPPLRIEFSEDSEECILSVQDSGPGIASEHLPFLFDRLYRVEASRTHSESHGLGLALVRSALQAHGGEVRLHSVVGTGSRFQLHFPKALAEVSRSDASSL